MKKAIVVGATSGIGKALSRELSKNNYRVGATGRRKELLLSLQQENPETYEISNFDCTLPNALVKLEELVSQLGGLDLLVFSSGTGDLNEELNFEIENNINQLNVVAFTEIVGWAYQYFENQKKGHLVAISSVAGLRGLKLCPSYNASKAFQINYLEGLRQKSNKIDVTITDIRPGFVDTVMAKGEGIFWSASPEKVSKQIYSLIKRKKGVGYVSKRWVFIAILLKVIPRKLHQKL